MIRLFFDNLRYRWREWRDKPREDYVSLRLVKFDETKRDW